MLKSSSKNKMTKRRKKKRRKSKTTIWLARIGHSMMSKIWPRLLLNFPLELLTDGRSLLSLLAKIKRRLFQKLRKFKLVSREMLKTEGRKNKKSRRDLLSWKRSKKRKQPSKLRKTQQTQPNKGHQQTMFGPTSNKNNWKMEWDNSEQTFQRKRDGPRLLPWWMERLQSNVSRDSRNFAARQRPRNETEFIVNSGVN